MNIIDYFRYKPSPKEKAERRKKFLQVQSRSQNPKIQAIIAEIKERQDLCPTRTLH